MTQPDILTLSYLLNHHMWLLYNQLEQVAHKRQAPGSWRIVLGSPGFEVVSQEQEGDSSKQQSPEMKQCPDGSCQGVFNSEHGESLSWGWFPG